jgi:hypothetical protein
MKKIFLFAALVLAITACDSSKNEEKTLQKEILDFHEKVMGDDEQAMIQKMKLDTIVQIAERLKIDKTAPEMLRSQLVVADNMMSDWMKGFTLDYTGKSHEEVIKYLQQQKKQVNVVDSLLLRAIKQATPYLQKTKTK